MGKKKVQSSTWLIHYIESQVLNTVSPAERTRYRLARRHGDEAQAAWVAEVLPKYPTLWSKMKNAERQRRFRTQAAPTRWQKDWAVARKVLGDESVWRLQVCREYLAAQRAATQESNQGKDMAYDQPIDLVKRAIDILFKQCQKQLEHAPATEQWDELDREHNSQRKPPARVQERSDQQQQLFPSLKGHRDQ